MSTNPPTDPRLREQSKTRNERIEDIAYTVNHAISCGVTDILVQPAASVAAAAMVHEDLLPKRLHWVRHLFEHHHDHGGHGHGHNEHHDHKPAHGHAHDHHHDHDHHHGCAAGGHAKTTMAEDMAEKSAWRRVWRVVRQEMRWGKFTHNLKHWALGETVGDVGAIVPTVLLQRWCPGVMQGIRQVTEPLAKGIYRIGAHRDALHWGARHGLAADTAEVKAKEADIIEHEMRHLPQAVAWNVFSIPINFGTQAVMAKPGSLNTRQKFTGFLVKFAVGKSFGTLFSNGVLLGGRAVAPETFSAWDAWNGEHVLKPVLYGTGRLFGVDKSATDKALQRHMHGTANDPAPPAANDPAPPAANENSASTPAAKKEWQTRTQRTDALEASR